MPAALVPGAAEASDTPLQIYAKARAAGSLGASAEAAVAYAAALAASPDNELLASRTFNEAVAAGNHGLALQAARTLERAGAIGGEVRLFLVSEALRTRNWKQAWLHLDVLARDPAFGFMVPVLRAWTSLESRQGNPFELLKAGDANPGVASYSREHRPLLLLAAGHRDQGAAELLTSSESAGMRQHRLRIAGAALLARKRDRQAALKLLAGDSPPLVAARRLVESRQNLPGEISTASAGAGEFLARVGGELYGKKVDELALRLARLSTFLAPENSETWIVTAELLGAEERYAPALAALNQVSAADPFAGTAEEMRIRLLVGSGQREAALAKALAATAAPGAGATDWIQLGMLQSELKRYSEAADAFARAQSLRGQAADQEPQWTFHFLRGGALEQAGRWPEAKAELQAAYGLAPTEPIVLNYLGYAQLERRENVEEAMKLIAEASRLAPDNAAITDSLGWAHFLRGDLPKAIELLERAASAEPADPEINEHLGDAYYAAGRRFEARYAWQAARLYAEAADAQRIGAKIETGLTPQLTSP